MNIAIIGTGRRLGHWHCLADFGLQITCVDQDKSKISLLSSGGVPIYEPNLENLIKKNVSVILLQELEEVNLKHQINELKKSKYLSFIRKNLVRLMVLNNAG
jgi:UDPglucose 6-dehydrogenase